MPKGVVYLKALESQNQRITDFMPKKTYYFMAKSHCVLFYNHARLVIYLRASESSLKQIKIQNITFFTVKQLSQLTVMLFWTNSFEKQTKIRTLLGNNLFTIFSITTLAVLTLPSAMSG